MYLGILETDGVLTIKMKANYERGKSEDRRKLMKSKVNGANLLKAVNIWVVLLLRDSQQLL